MSITISESVRASFDGHELRTSLCGYPSTNCQASIGECFYISHNGMNKAPSVIRAEMPKSRGQKIAWSLSFSTKASNVTSFDEFWKAIRDYKEKTSKDVILTVKKDVYGIALVQNAPGKHLLKPLVAYVADNISQENLKQLIKDFTDYRPLFCPPEFLSLL